MNGTADIYCDTIHEQLRDYYATWLPQTKMALGDYGPLLGTRFQRRGNVADFGVKGANVCIGSAEASVQVTSRSGVSVDLKAAAALPAGTPPAKATLEVGFGKGDAVFFNAAELALNEVKDQTALAKQILKLFSAGIWEHEWHVVTAVAGAAATTVAISNNEGARLVLEAETPGEVLNLAKASAKLSATTTKDLGAQIVSEQGLTPLIKLSKVRRKFFKQPAFSTALVTIEPTLDEVRKLAVANGMDFEELFELARVS
jgi:hypothetical protein